MLTEKQWEIVVYIFDKTAFNRCVVCQDGNALECIKFNDMPYNQCYLSASAALMSFYVHSGCYICKRYKDKIAHVKGDTFICMDCLLEILNSIEFKAHKLMCYT